MWRGFVFPGGGPVLGRRPGGVGQPGSAATPNEAPGGVSEDVGGAVLRREYTAYATLQSAKLISCVCLGVI